MESQPDLEKMADDLRAELEKGKISYETLEARFEVWLDSLKTNKGQASFGVARHAHPNGENGDSWHAYITDDFTVVRVLVADPAADRSSKNLTLQSIASNDFDAYKTKTIELVSSALNHSAEQVLVSGCRKIDIE